MVEGKNAFLDHKKENSKKSKNWDLFKGVSPLRFFQGVCQWFWLKEDDKTLLVTF